jgi:hypothetical protein
MQTSGVFRLFFVICLGTRGDYRSAEGVSTTWRTGVRASGLEARGANIRQAPAGLQSL